MKRTACLNRNCLRRPAVRKLVPDLKLLWLALKINCETHIGVWALGLGALGEDSGFEKDALEGGLAALQQRGLILLDEETGEVFLTDFFRENTFKTPARRGQAWDDWIRIQSLVIRKQVSKAIFANPECGLEGDLFDKSTN